MTATKRLPPAAEIASWCLVAAALLLVLQLHLLPALLAGLLVYELIHVLAPLLPRLLPGRRARLAAVVILSITIVGVVTAAILGAVALFRSDAGSVAALVQKLADIIDGTRDALPAWLDESLPANASELREALVHWLREHGTQLGVAGAEAGVAFAHVIIGMAIGAIVSLREAAPTRNEKPLARALIERTGRLGDAFRRVVFAQLRISALNTVFTAIYLGALLPLFGVQLPLVKTLVGITFVTGLLPVIGNLISNAIIVTVSLAHSPYAAVASLVFLVVIHKLEYFLNASIVGLHIQSRVWELLLAMLVMQAAFGLPGLVAAPIYYAYLKRELTDAGLV